MPRGYGITPKIFKRIQYNSKNILGAEGFSTFTDWSEKIGCSPFNRKSWKEVSIDDKQTRFQLW